MVAESHVGSGPGGSDSVTTGAGTSGPRLPDAKLAEQARRTTAAFHGSTYTTVRGQASQTGVSACPAADGATQEGALPPRQLAGRGAGGPRVSTRCLELVASVQMLVCKRVRGHVCVTGLPVDAPCFTGQKLLKCQLDRSPRLRGRALVRRQRGRLRTHGARRLTLRLGVEADAGRPGKGGLRTSKKGQSEHVARRRGHG